MQTVSTVTLTSPSIYLAIESSDYSQEVKAQLSDLGCRCSSHSNLTDFGQMLETETPALVVVSLDLAGQCALQFCQNHSRLLREIPVIFFAGDASRSFEKALAAIRLGAIDVLVPPLSDEVLLKIAQAAKRISGRPEAWEVPAESSSDIPLPANGEATLLASSIQSALKTPEFASEKATISFAINPSDADQEAELPQTHSLMPDVSSGPGKFATTNGSSSDPCPRLQERQENHALNVKELESWILGSSPAMQAVRSIIAEVAETKANVMIYGASGTGKELVATAVHKLSKRSDGPFEPVNMTEIPHELAESLLFGHERGSFTGADSRQIGVCEAADGGTLFLDEIGEMPLATQPKLLRFLQESTVKRVGSRSFKKVDVRVITATNRTPETIVQQGLMREDLFFRLHVVPIHIPSLQQRPEDIEQLAMLFLHRYAKEYDRSVEGFTQEALDVFRRHDWPGNVRQLENVVERLVVFAKGRTIEVSDIPTEIHTASIFDSSSPGDLPGHRPHAIDKIDYQAANRHDAEVDAAVALMSPIQRTERTAIIEALERSRGHVIDAANFLGLGQATVYRKIKQYRIPHQRRRRRTPK